MISTDPVLRAAVPVYDELTAAYGRVRKLLAGASGLAGSSPATGEARGALQHTLNTTVEDAIRNMRTAMRLDLGVSADPGSASDECDTDHARDDL
jgi:hypothetical protein